MIVRSRFQDATHLPTQPLPPLPPPHIFRVSSMVPFSGRFVFERVTCPSRRRSRTETRTFVRTIVKSVPLFALLSLLQSEPITLVSLLVMPFSTMAIRTGWSRWTTSWTASSSPRVAGTGPSASWRRNLEYHRFLSHFIGMLAPLPLPNIADDVDRIGESELEPRSVSAERRSSALCPVSPRASSSRYRLQGAPLRTYLTNQLSVLFSNPPSHARASVCLAC